jgi:hypothetical protein
MRGPIMQEFSLNDKIKSLGKEGIQANVNTALRRFVIAHYPVSIIKLGR